MSPTPEEACTPLSPRPTGKQRVTLRDIAEKIGVSHATVCLALHDNPRISKTRCLQIKEVALQLGYHPDPMLTALSHYRRSSGTPPTRSSIAWLSFWDDPQKMHAYSELHHYWLGTKEVVESHGYRLEVFSPRPDYPLARIQRVIQSRNISGIVVAPPQGGLPIELENFDWTAFSLVKFGHSLPRLPAHTITSAHVSNALLAHRKITERGYKRIGFVTTHSSFGRTRFSCGFLRGQLDSAPEDRLPILCLTDHATADDHAALSQWLKLHRPDSILTNLSQAQGMLASLGLRIPQDIGLATFSIHDGLAAAGIDQNPLEIGRAAAETLISLINQNTRGIPSIPRELLIEGLWVDGHSLPDLTKTPPAPSEKENGPPSPFPEKIARIKTGSTNTP